MIIFFEMVPPSKYPTFTSVVSAIFAVSLLLGPLIGGAINNNTTWRWVFILKCAALFCVFTSFGFYRKVSLLMLHPKCSSRLSLHSASSSHLTDRFPQSRPGNQSYRKGILEIIQESRFRWCRIATIRVYLPYFGFTRGSQRQSMVFSSGSDSFGLVRATLDWLSGLGVVCDNSQTCTGAGVSLASLNKPN